MITRMDREVGRVMALVKELELDAILTGLARNDGNKPRTAEELGISLKTLYNKLHQLPGGALDKSA